MEWKGMGSDGMGRDGMGWYYMEWNQNELETPNTYPDFSSSFGFPPFFLGISQYPTRMLVFKGPWRWVGKSFFFQILGLVSSKDFMEKEHEFWFPSLPGGRSREGQKTKSEEDLVYLHCAPEGFWASLIKSSQNNSDIL